MTTSGLLGNVDLDPERVAADLAAIERLGFVDSYDEFVCGSWRTCVLWNASGDGADAVIHDYEGVAQLTEHGHKTPYLVELVERYANLDRLRFARVTRLSPGSVVVPHVDYVELGAPLVRIHLPLLTAAEAYASEFETIYHMARGEAWFLDATQPHSIANFSATPRLHLLLDFSGEGPQDALRNPVPDSRAIPAVSTVARAPFTERDRDALAALALIADRNNVMDILSLVIKKYFRTEMGILDVFATIRRIAEGSSDSAVAERVEWLESHALAAR